MTEPKDDAADNSGNLQHNEPSNAAPHPQNVAAFGSQPRLHPAPGRCIVRIVPRVLEAVSDGGVVGSLDGRYQNQPMVGSLQAIGDATSERERVIAEWAEAQAEAGALFTFSMFGAGSPYWDDEMRKMIPLGFDFTWLQGLRLFDITQLSATMENTGAYGEFRRPAISLRDLEIVQ